ncbi:MAG TPA: N-acetylmuramoyl-L-alanine amidase [Bacteroidaceae bacterium]|nr:N-acetylmuramoyl-L-alanine amidase [Bacteroidaceae bacterium]
MKTGRIISFWVIISLLFNIPVYVKADREFILVLDAGHGGKDPGAVNGKNQEKTINLKVTLRAGELIQENCPNVKVIYTRNEDVFVELYKRAEIANKAQADLFISIHTNAAKNSSAHGAETYLLGYEESRTSANFNVAIEENKAILYESNYEENYAGYDPNSPESQIIFEFLQNEYQKESLRMATLVQNQLTGYAKRANHGVHQAGYLVLWRNAMPSILVELGYISNNNEMKYMISEKGVEELSQSIYRAFSQYLEETRQLSASVVKPLFSSNSSNTLSETNQSDQISTETPVFKVQFLTSSEPLKENDSKFKGIRASNHYLEDGLYKYIYFESTIYQQAVNAKNDISSKFKDAFIIAFINGKRSNLREAIDIAKQK